MHRFFFQQATYAFHNSDFVALKYCFPYQITFLYIAKTTNLLIMSSSIPESNSTTHSTSEISGIEI